MYLKQYYLGCLAQASYLIGDEGSRLAILVDPQAEVESYLEDARQQGLKIFAVFLTHLPAEGYSGYPALQRLGIEVYAGAQAPALPGVSPVRDGDGMDLGTVRLRVLETPGHSPEAISVVLYDLAWDEREPYAVLTGQTLLVGDVGRPELVTRDGRTAAEMAGVLYDSLHGKLMRLPDAALVYPSLGVGSTCGQHVVTDTVTMIGIQRRSNYALQPMSREELVRLMTAELPESPEHFTPQALERRLPERAEVLDHALRPLGLDEVLALQRAGAQVLDVRSPVEFAGAHLAGSVNIGLRGRFSTWTGALLDSERPLVLVAAPGTEREAALRLSMPDLGRVHGYLEGGMLALQGRPDLLEWTDRVTVRALVRQISSSEPPLVLDVRSEREWRASHIDGSLVVPLNELPERLSELPRSGSIVVVCTSGYRSSLAASLLKERGWRDVSDLVGGYVAWQSAWAQTHAWTATDADRAAA
jgi:hydroxyacylglutathione hydrolase